MKGGTWKVGKESRGHGLFPRSIKKQLMNPFPPSPRIVQHHLFIQSWLVEQRTRMEFLGLELRMTSEPIGFSFLLRS